MLIILFFGVIIYMIYNYVIKPMNYWKSKNVVYEAPVPFFGSMLPLVLRLKGHTEVFSEAYKKYENQRYFGLYNFRLPVLIVRDPDLVKTIFVKEFDTFPQHRPFIPEGVDPLWSMNLFAMKGGQEWHDLRSTLSPSFTSSKMKTMFGLMKECSQQFSEHFSNTEGLVEIELKDVFSRFASDVIATTGFGITTNSLSNPNNEFHVLAKNFTNFRGIRGLLILYTVFAPKLAKYLNITMFNSKVRKFFTTLVKENIQQRREQGIVRPDMLQLLMQVQTGQLQQEENVATPETGFAVVQEHQLEKEQKKQKIQVTDEIITAQVLIFLFAGFDTVSTLLSYVCYELAINPDVQHKLREEVDEVLNNSNQEFTYENVTTMKYLDQVITETLRKWPPFIIIDRQSARPFTIEPKRPGERVLHLDSRTAIVCPVFSIHRDPKYYPNPDKFDPERFSQENKDNIHPYTYLPFGAGPRNCIASRFALLEGKLIVAEIISKFELVPVEKTLIPMVISKNNFNPLPDNGIWVGLKARSK